MTFWDQLEMLAHFAMLSAIAVGGAVSMVPDISRYMVDEKGLLTAAQFSEAIAVAQAVPGPNVLFVTLLGWQTAGPNHLVETVVSGDRHLETHHPVAIRLRDRDGIGLMQANRGKDHLGTGLGRDFGQNLRASLLCFALLSHRRRDHQAPEQAHSQH